ncbi:MAG: fatty acid desaturase [Kiritimatiellales bacterium]|nr:fatty acid desaturase [Kiritimatiellales bacterium]MCF7863226.1 fatty acid desaturase [Kiritimatiellales bacterium]
MNLEFTPREELSEYEWNHEGRNWKRMGIDKEVVKQLSERSTWNGLWRVGLFLSFLVATAAATMLAAQYSLWLAIIPLYGYYFFYGFWVAIGHELQHSTVFAKNFDGVSEPFFYLVQALMWNSPTYARKSHQLHHRYTMVRGIDPETDWPEVFDTNFVRKPLLSFIQSILVVGAVRSLFDAILMQIRRALGIKDRMMRDHCTEKEIAAIRRESLGILLFHMAVVAIAIVFGRWEPLAFIMIAWQIGSPIEGLWHNTEHISRLYNVNDQRLCTRSVKVGPLVHLIYWGLDDHIDHHIYPLVPSRNLPKLHNLLHKELPEPLGMMDCWREIFAVAREKDVRPNNEFVPYEF